MLIAVLGLFGFRFGSHLLHTASPCGSLSGASEALTDLVGGLESPVLGIAHNAGASGNEVKRAIDCGATVIEIDVVAVEGQILAAHDVPAPGEVKDAPRLAELWPLATQAPRVNLDLKPGAPELTDLVAAFLRESEPASAGKVSVSSPDVAVLQTLRERAPDVRRYLSLETPEQFAALRKDREARQLIDGVTIQETLLDAAAVSWLDEQQLDVWAWRIDDPRRAEELMSLRIDGIITDNLALLDVLRADDTDDD